MFASLSSTLHRSSEHKSGDESNVFLFLLFYFTHATKIPRPQRKRRRMSTIEANGAGVHPDEDQRRSSFGRPSALDPVQQPGGPVIGGVTQHHAGTYPEQAVNFGRDDRPAPSHSGVPPPSHFAAQHGSSQPLPTGSMISGSSTGANTMAETLQLLQQQMAQQQQLLNQIMCQRMYTLNPAVPSFQPEQVIEALSRNISEFRFDGESGITFRAWFSRYDELFKKDAARIDDAAKVRLLLRKLGPIEHDRYLSFILPARASDFHFDETIAQLETLFDTRESLLSKRFKCLQLHKKSSEDHLTFACRLNKACVDFELSKMGEEQLKCLLFVCGLKDESDKDMRTRMLARIEDKPDVTLQQLSAECHRIVNLKRDSAMIESNAQENVFAVQSREQWFQRSPPTQLRNPRYNCFKCGDLHWVSECPFYNNKCNDCNRFGHKEGYCQSSHHELFCLFVRVYLVLSLLYLALMADI